MKENLEYLQSLLAEARLIIFFCNKCGRIFSGETGVHDDCQYLGVHVPHDPVKERLVAALERLIERQCEQTFEQWWDEQQNEATWTRAAANGTDVSLALADGMMKEAARAAWKQFAHIDSPLLCPAAPAEDAPADARRGE